MHKLRLLERMKAWETGEVSRFNESNEVDILKSILGHVERMLNTKKGGVKLFNDYGVPEFHDLSEGLIEDEINKVITKYEPRLVVDSVIRQAPKDTEPSNIEVSIVGKIKGKENLLRFTTVLTANGRVTIQL
ncbi:type VI secretion system baseplate subunit TssE [Thiotrichales bacterium 19S3-7]|nr:type VI secretion system baseplate subunit TssE [Thiotrichales bacterium 19S3-7]MCF6802143.1 type VI secretion system baseplate subunit TssE [Thiotrichales bacterium 19S3-11]